MDYVEVFDSGVCVPEAREASLKVFWKCIYVDIIISKTNIYMPIGYCKSVSFRGKTFKNINLCFILRILFCITVSTVTRPWTDWTSGIYWFDSR